METRVRLSLLSSARSLRRFSSDVDIWMMKLTMKLRMPGEGALASAVVGGRGLSGTDTILTKALIARKNLPPGHDDTVKHL